MTSITLAFDVYGTLIDTHGVVSRLEAMVGGEAEAFSLAWRDKQLEYSFRRGLMQNYENFAACTSRALDFTDAQLGTGLTTEQKKTVLASYRALPAFGDVREGLTDLKAAGFGLYAFSNGAAEAVDALLDGAGIRGLFLDVVSTDEIRSFKPNPAVYRHFLKRAGATADRTWLISGNPFDVIGAISAGLLAAWVRRSEKAIFDPWDIAPTTTVTGLGDLRRAITGYHGGKAG